jgi:hypothetical protein
LRLLPNLKSKGLVLLPPGTKVKLTQTSDAHRVQVKATLPVETLVFDMGGSKTTETTIQGWASLYNALGDTMILLPSNAPSIKSNSLLVRAVQNELKVLPAAKEKPTDPIPESMLFEVIGESGATIREGPHLESKLVFRDVPKGEPLEVILPRGTLLAVYGLHKSEKETSILNRRVFVQQLPPGFPDWMYIAPYDLHINSNLEHMSKGWASIVSADGYPILRPVDLSAYNFDKRTLMNKKQIAAAASSAAAKRAAAEALATKKAEAGAAAAATALTAENNVEAMAGFVSDEERAEKATE